MSANPQWPGQRRTRVTLSTSSVYPLGPAAAFELAARLGYDGVEVMVLSDPITQDAATLARLARVHGVPVCSIHAPTLLVAQRVWGTTDPWGKIDRSIDLALELECDTIVLHPPFRWQKDYARTFIDGIAEREDAREVRLAVENMFPWRARQTHLQAYLPAWDPVPQPYDNVTLDLSHAATAGADVLAMQAALGGRLAHVHLADGSGSMKDEHLVPGRGRQPCGAFLQACAGNGFDGDVAVEVSTRKAGGRGREEDLAEALDFARRHLAGATADLTVGSNVGSNVRSNVDLTVGSTVDSNVRSNVDLTVGSKMGTTVGFAASGTTVAQRTAAITGVEAAENGEAGEPADTVRRDAQTTTGASGEHEGEGNAH